MTHAAGVGAPRPRVLIVVNVSWFFLSHRLELAKRALATGYEVHVATSVSSSEDRAGIEGARLVLHDLPFARSGGLLSDVRCLVRLASLYRSLQPALVHLVTMKPVLLGGLAARCGGRPAVLAAMTGLGHAFSSRGLWARVRRTLLLAGLHLALPKSGRCAALFQNEDDRALMLQSGIVEPQSTALIRGSGVDLSRFVPSAEAAGPVRVVLPARMIRQKGILQFVEAARALIGKHPDAQFLLAGNPDPGNPMSLNAQQLRDLCCGQAIQWLGFVPDMSALLASCHIVCLPTYYGEGVPKSLIEAAAAGRPIVTTDIPGCRDIVRDGENGFLVACTDTPGLIVALDRLIADPALRRRFGATGRRIAEREFGLEAVVDATLHLYRQLIERNSLVAPRAA